MADTMLSDEVPWRHSDPLPESEAVEIALSPDTLPDRETKSAPNSGGVRNCNAEMQEKEVPEASGARFGKDSLAKFEGQMMAALDNLREKVKSLSNDELTYMMEENAVCTRLYKDMFNTLLSEKVYRLGLKDNSGKTD